MENVNMPLSVSSRQELNLDIGDVKLCHGYTLVSAV